MSELGPSFPRLSFLTIRGRKVTPLNLWRIVILTENNDRQFHRPFEEMVKAGGLPGFLEIYIEKDLHVKLSRRQP